MGDTKVKFPLDSFDEETATDALDDLRKELLSAKEKGLDALELERKKWIEMCEDNRKEGVRISHIEGACRYILLAKDEPEGLGSDGNPSEVPKAVRFFHYAGNAFRRADKQKRSAEAYYNSAQLATMAHKWGMDARGLEKTLMLGMESASRARSMFDSVGNDENANDAHTLRLDLRREYHFNAWRPFKDRLPFDAWRHFNGSLLGFVNFLHSFISWVMLLVWGGLTRYGTSPSRWLGTLVIALLCMASIYWILCSNLPPVDGALIPALHFDNGPCTNRTVTAVFLAVTNLFAFGGYTNITPLNALGQIVLMFQSLISFLWLGSAATFLTRR